MHCLRQFRQRDPAIYAPFTVWYTTQTGSPQVCKRAFRFISLERPPGRSFWQLLCQTEERPIHSRGFNVILRGVAWQLDVTIKMVGPWAMDHSQGGNMFFSSVDGVYGYISGPANGALDGSSAVTYHCRSANEQFGQFCHVFKARQQPLQTRNLIPILWSDQATGSNMTITHSERPACQKPSQLMIGDGG